MIHPTIEQDYKEITEHLGDSMDRLKGTTILLTGSTGMIGSYFLEFLCYLNQTRFCEPVHIICPVRSPILHTNKRLGYLSKNVNIQWVEADLAKPFDMSCLPDSNYIIHAASPASPRQYLSSPISTVDVNVSATRSFLENSVKNKSLRVFLYVSSGEIYGSPGKKDVPTPETYIGLTNHLAERSCYVESKRFSETLSLIFYRQHRIPVKIVRPVHLYGPGIRLDDGRVWADFLNRALNRKDIVILSDGLARRGFCYIRDATIQMFAVLLKGNIGEVYNVGNENHVSIRELAAVVKEQSRADIDIVIKNQVPDYLKGSPQISCPSTEKVFSLIHINKTTLHEGIGKTIEWAKSFYKIGKI